MKKTKKIVALLLSAVMAVSAVPAGTVTAAAASSSGKTAVKVWNGKADTSWYSSKKTTFNISTAEQLAGLAKIVDSGKETFDGKTVKLTKDIKLNDTSNFSKWESDPPKNVWEPIGFSYNWNRDLYFSGTFDGQGHTISGMYVTDWEQGAGLFSCVNTAIVKNVRLEKCAVIHREKRGSYHPTGILAADCDNSYIESCEAKDIYINTQSKVTGGLIGEAAHINGNIILGVGLAFMGEVLNPILYADLDKDKKFDATYISNCKVSDIKISDNIAGDTPVIGGIVGSVEEGYLYNCLSVNVSASSWSARTNPKVCGKEVGALVGKTDKKKIKSCYYCNFKRTDNGTAQYDKKLATKVAKSKLSSSALLKKLGDGFKKGKDGTPKVKSIIAG